MNRQYFGVEVARFAKKHFIYSRYQEVCTGIREPFNELRIVDTLTGFYCFFEHFPIYNEY